MLYIKSYCYSKHELPFIISQLYEGYNHIDKLVLYEYNYTHVGTKKDYEVEKVLHLIPDNLRNKLDYKKIDLTHCIEYSNTNEPIQRSWLFNDIDYNLSDDDIIIDCDIDEIIYSCCYDNLINELHTRNIPLSIKLNQFFFKNNYLWSNLIFTSPTIYKYSMVKNINTIKHNIKIKNLRDIHNKTNDIYGCHMSWVMPIDFMINKLNSYAHTEFKKFADKDILEKAIKEKKYIFEPERPFNIIELKYDDIRIPKYLQNDNLFSYLV